VILGLVLYMSSDNVARHPGIHVSVLSQKWCSHSWITTCIAGVLCNCCMACFDAFGKRVVCLLVDCKMYCRVACFDALGQRVVCSLVDYEICYWGAGDCLALLSLLVMKLQLEAK
jgi:hypothetical protein